MMTETTIARSGADQGTPLAGGALKQSAAASRSLLLLAIPFAICMVGLAIAGGVLTWSPVPFWDMWDGYLDFFVRQQAGEIGAWWMQQNEHRILLARMLFWLDLKWFGGMSVFLIVCNYLLVACTVLLFCRILRQLAGTATVTAGEWAARLFLTAWLFLWAQQENLTWAFQSQFFLAQLLPLCAVYWLSEAQHEDGLGRHFLLAAAFGVSSIGAMANGIIALPMLVVYAIMTRQGGLKIAVLAVLSALGLAAFLYHYNIAGDHAPIHQVLREHPLEMLAYGLRYLGAPFYYLANAVPLIRGTPWASQFALVAGLVLVICTLYRLWRVLASPRRGPALALLFFIAYIFLSAMLTAGGRLFLGIEQAFSSRYTTPGLMAWTALAVQYFPLLRSWGKAWQALSVLALAALGAVMLVFQMQALAPLNDTMFGRRVAVLALAMKVQDRTQIVQVYPVPERALALAAQAVEKGLTVFGHYPLQDAAARMGQPWAESGPRCEGSLASVQPVAGDPRYMRVEGTLHAPGGTQAPGFVRLLAAGKVVGYALTGGIAMASGAQTRTGFAGYVQAAALGGEVILQGDKPACSLHVHLSAPLFSVLAVAPSVQLASVSSANILEGNQWLGSDFYQTKIDGMRVYGSSIHGDQDTGTISLRLKRGDRFFYRSGPTAGRQILEVEGHPQLSMTLPSMIEWTQVVLDSAALPSGELVVRLVDNGSGWGEWSALALKTDGAAP